MMYCWVCGMETEHVRGAEVVSGEVVIVPWRCCNAPHDDETKARAMARAFCPEDVLDEVEKALCGKGEP